MELNNTFKRDLMVWTIVLSVFLFMTFFSLNFHRLRTAPIFREATNSQSISFINGPDCTNHQQGSLEIV